MLREELAATGLSAEAEECRRMGWAGWWCLTGILVVAAAFRFYGLAKTGILSIDEGRYFLDGLSKYIELRGCFDMVRGKVAELRGGPEFLLSDYLPGFSHDLREVHPFSPKLGFNYLTALVMACLGVCVHAGNIVEALSGVLMVAVLFALVRSLHGTRAGLISAAILALSSYHIYFSRNAYPQSSSVLLLLVALWIHLNWGQAGRRTDAGGMGRLALCGVFAGLSLWVNYQAAGAMPCLCLVHLAACLGAGSRAVQVKAFVLGGLAIAAGFMAVMLAAEAASYPMLLLFRSQGMPYPHATFFELLWPRVAAQSSVPLGSTGLLLFPYFLYVIEGPIEAFGGRHCACRRRVPRRDGAEARRHWIHRIVMASRDHLPRCAFRRSISGVLAQDHAGSAHVHLRPCRSSLGWSPSPQARCGAYRVTGG